MKVLRRILTIQCSSSNHSDLGGRHVPELYFSVGVPDKCDPVRLVSPLNTNEKHREQKNTKIRPGRKRTVASYFMLPGEPLTGHRHFLPTQPKQGSARLSRLMGGKQPFSRAGFQPTQMFGVGTERAVVMRRKRTQRAQPRREALVTTLFAGRSEKQTHFFISCRLEASGSCFSIAAPIEATTNRSFT